MKGIWVFLDHFMRTLQVRGQELSLDQTQSWALEQLRVWNIERITDTFPPIRVWNIDRVTDTYALRDDQNVKQR